ncbi:UNKNOWN [Stylonychia lemnae]|uniref:Amino acid transporter transmembrane domain-containing protein n=1 Tax=Stylonychia lemnae TaxID=5949 RepID=A0A078B979_STYLE|nr:UNKNOWN [Stylonychia lemnae]|eukprot:CDW90791.1 UNKNOWN [Stylonychia lemnae]
MDCNLRMKEIKGQLLLSKLATTTTTLSSEMSQRGSSTSQVGLSMKFEDIMVWDSEQNENQLVEIQQQNPQNGSLNLFQTSLAYVSTIIGGGIVSLPYAFMAAGIYVGVLVHITSVFLMLASVWFCLKAKDFLGYEYVAIPFQFTFIYKGTVIQESDQPPVISKHEDFSFEKLMDSFNIVITAYGFVINFFPVYKNLKGRSNTRGFITVIMALFFCFSTYLLFSLMTHRVYGSELKPSIFENIKNDSGIISYTLRSLFSLIFFCNIPFVFFAGKECVLTMILEYRERKVSIKLEKDLERQHLERLLLEVGGMDQEKLQKQQEINEEQIENKLYYPTVILFFLTQCILGFVISDLTIIFGFVSACSEATVSFIFPGLFFIIAAKRSRKIVPLYQSIGALCFSLFGLVFFMISNYFNFLKLLRD